MGNEFVGIIEKKGSAVKGFVEGDRVYGRLPLKKIGAFAEYAAVDSLAIAKVPEYLSDEETAVDEVFDLGDVNRALKKVASGGAKGKTILKIS